MKISDLLCSPIVTCAPPRVHTKEKKRQSRSSTKFIPEDQRKRPYRMSVTQKDTRRECQEHESRVFNLTMDINELKQQVQYLLECRDLQVSCLLHMRQRLKNEVLRAVDKILFGEDVRPRYGDVSQMLMDQLGVPSLPNGIYELHLQLNKPNFNHRSCSVATTQVITVVEQDQEADDKDSAELLKICSESGGCLVEVVSWRLSRGGCWRIHRSIHAPDTCFHVSACLER